MSGDISHTPDSTNWIIVTDTQRRPHDCMGPRFVYNIMPNIFEFLENFTKPQDLK